MNFAQISEVREKIYKAKTIVPHQCDLQISGDSLEIIMKMFIVLSMLVIVTLARPDGDHYDSKYDDFDVETLIGNPRMMKAYTKCLLSKGSCTAEGSSFKKILPEAVATACGKCTPRQRTIVRTVIRELQKQLPEEWKQLVKQYDPEGKYKESFAKFLSGSD